MKEIRGRKSRDIYYYDEENMTVSDKEGNVIRLYESLDGLDISIISDFIDNMFKKLYIEQNEIKKLCRDLKEMI